MNITQLKTGLRNQYGELMTDFEVALRVAYPKLQFATHSPGSFGGNPDFYLRDSQTLSYPTGEYKSSKHYHKSGAGILTIEDARDSKLNLKGKPLFLLTGRCYNGDYKSLSKTYWLFGQNEDLGYFLHKVRPQAAKNGNLEEVRSWIWNLKGDESVAFRQGDMGLIRRIRNLGFPEMSFSGIDMGRHRVEGEKFWSNGDRVIVRDPRLTHAEHDPVELKGLYELRLARAWRSSSAD